MANCNQVIPVMDWTEDAELDKTMEGGGRIGIRIIPIREV